MKKHYRLIFHEKYIITCQCISHLKQASGFTKPAEDPKPPTDEERVASIAPAGGVFWELDNYDEEDDIWKVLLNRLYLKKMYNALWTSVRE